MPLLFVPPCMEALAWPSITMASRCLDNLLPPGLGDNNEADYLCLTATSVIMYHGDGSTVSTTGDYPPTHPSPQKCPAVHLSSSPGGRAYRLPSSGALGW